MHKGIFITGTDTGVGKTHVACLIAEAMRERFKRAGVMKPAESGCPEEEGRLMPQDALRLRAAAGCGLPLELICPYALPLPLAPAEAARRAGVDIDIERIKKNFEEISAASDAVLVEGAGGLLVPLSGKFLFADLIKKLGLPLLIVARAGLGTVNHSLLTIEAAERRGIQVLGVVLNTSTKTEADVSLETNARLLADLASVPVLGPLPYASGAPSADERRRAQEIVSKIFRMAFD